MDKPIFERLTAFNITTVSSGEHIVHDYTTENLIDHINGLKTMVIELTLNLTLNREEILKLKDRILKLERYQKQCTQVEQEFVSGDEI